MREILDIMLYMDTEEDYGERATERIRHLWETCQMEESSYRNIDFYVGEKNQYPWVCARRNKEKKVWEFEVYGENTPATQELLQQVNEKLNEKR